MVSNDLKRAWRYRPDFRATEEKGNDRFDGLYGMADQPDETVDNPADDIEDGVDDPVKESRDVFPDAGDHADRCSQINP